MSRRLFDEQAEFDRAVALAADSDVAVVVVGTNEEVESEGFDRTSLALPGRQDELVRAVASCQPANRRGGELRVRQCCSRGRTTWLLVLVSWFPGQEFGNALADVLIGAVEPGGRLAGDLAGLRGWAAGGDAREWRAPVRRRPADRIPLVSGDRAALRLPVRTRAGLHHLGVRGIATDGDTVTVTVRNTGNRAGREVVQLYASRPDSTVAAGSPLARGLSGRRCGAGEVAKALDHRRRPQFPALGQLVHGWTIEPGRTSCTPAAQSSTCRSQRPDLPRLGTLHCSYPSRGGRTLGHAAARMHTRVCSPRAAVSSN